MNGLNDETHLKGALILPDFQYNVHPVSTGHYIIPTTEIIKMYNKVRLWIEGRRPGGIIYGKPRIGKTKALQYLISQLPLQSSTNLPIFSAICKKHSKPNEDVFYKELLCSFNHAFAVNGKATEKRQRIINLFIEAGERSGQRRIVLFLDEADRLHSPHFDWLMDIYNELDSAGISMTVISVGQLDLKFLRSSFIHQKKAQIIGRFMVNEHEYHGLVSASQTKICLEGYDISVFPENSHCSYTEYFFPHAYSEGKRLSDFKDVLYNSFLNLRIDNGLSKKFEIPMQHLTAAIEYILKYNEVYDKNIHWPTDELWAEAVKHSGYLESEILMDVMGTVEAK